MVTKKKKITFWKVILTILAIFLIFQGISNLISVDEKQYTLETQEETPKTHTEEPKQVEIKEHSYTEDLILKNTKIITEKPNEQAFKTLGVEPITNHFLIGEVCNIGKQDYHGSGLVCEIGLYKEGELLNSLLAIPNPTEILLKKDSCISFKHPLDKKYDYDEIKGTPYFMHGFCGEDNPLC